MAYQRDTSSNGTVRAWYSQGLDSTPCTDRPRKHQGSESRHQNQTTKQMWSQTPKVLFKKKIKKASDKDAERTDVSHSSEGLKSKIKVSPYPAIKQSFKCLQMATNFVTFSHGGRKKQALCSYLCLKRLNPIVKIHL